jgi:hypothetical protein
MHAAFGPYDQVWGEVCCLFSSTDPSVDGVKERLRHALFHAGVLLNDGGVYRARIPQISVDGVAAPVQEVTYDCVIVASDGLCESASTKEGIVLHN